MNNNHIIQQQLEFDGTETEAQELDKLLLRIFENPSLQSYLMGVGEKDGKIELDFLALPPNAVEAAKKAIGPTAVEVLKYSVHDRPHTGLRFSLQPLIQLGAGSDKL